MVGSLWYITVVHFVNFMASGSGSAIQESQINIVDSFVVDVIVMIFFRDFPLFCSDLVTSLYSGETASNISDTVNPELGDICLCFQILSFEFNFSNSSVFFCR
jgi:hypothetical protein